MTTQSIRKPFLPEDLQRNGKPRDALWRAAYAEFVAKVHRRDPLDLVRDHRPAELLLRADADPATLAGSGWADTLAATAVEDAIVGLAGPSAGAELIRRGMRVDLGRRAAINVPARVCDPDDAGGFVADGSPIPVKVLSIDAGPTLKPFKLAAICALSNEVIAYSNGQRVVTQLASEAMALRLDAELFSSTAASPGVRPAGLLNSVSPITAAEAGSEVMVIDIASLVAALATAGAGTNPVFVCSPPQAAALKFKAGAQFNYPILSSAALAAKTIVAIEAGSFVSGFDPVPRFEVSDQATLHMSDTPLPLVDGDGVLAEPIRSGWQTDTSALKIILRCSFGMRATGHVQYITGTAW